MFVKLDKPEFIGRDACAKQKAEGIAKKVVGIELNDRAIPRGGYEVEADGQTIGVVTTGYHTITTDRSVCLASSTAAMPPSARRWVCASVARCLPERCARSVSTTKNTRNNILKIKNIKTTELWLRQ